MYLFCNTHTHQVRTADTDSQRVRATEKVVAVVRLSSAVQGVTCMIEWVKHLLSFLASCNNKAWFENSLPKALDHASYVAWCAGAPYLVPFFLCLAEKLNFLDGALRKKSLILAPFWVYLFNFDKTISCQRPFSCCFGDVFWAIEDSSPQRSSNMIKSSGIKMELELRKFADSYIKNKL